MAPNCRNSEEIPVFQMSSRPILQPEIEQKKDIKLKPRINVNLITCSPMKGSRLAIQPFDLQDSTFLGLLTRSAVFSYVSINQNGCLPANPATIESRDKITGIYYPTFISLFALVNTAMALQVDNIRLRFTHKFLSNK